MSSSSAPASAGSPSPSASPRPGGASSCSSATTSTAASWPRVRHDGFTFDTGPSLLTLPARARRAVPRGRDVARPTRSTCVRLDPQFHYRWPDGPTLVVPDDPDARADAFDAFAPGAGAAWRRFDEHGRRIWEVSERTFLAGPMTGAARRSPADALARATCWRSTRCARSTARRRRTSTTRASCSGPGATRRTRARRRSGRRRRWPASRTSSRATAAGTRGAGSTRCAPRCERVAERVGVEVRTGAEVVRIATAGDAVAGVELADGSTWRPPRRRGQRRRRARLRRPAARRPAAAAGAAGRPLDERLRRARRRVRGATPGIGHHNVWFSRRRPRRVRRSRRRPHGRRPDDLRLRLVGHRPDAGAGRERELVPARQRAARDRASTRDAERRSPARRARWPWRRPA